MSELVWDSASNHRPTSDLVNKTNNVGLHSIPSSTDSSNSSSFNNSAQSNNTVTFTQSTTSYSKDELQLELNAFLYPIRHSIPISWSILQSQLTQISTLPSPPALSSPVHIPPSHQKSPGTSPLHPISPVVVENLSATQQPQQLSRSLSNSSSSSPVLPPSHSPITQSSPQIPSYALSLSRSRSMVVPPSSLLTSSTPSSASNSTSTLPKKRVKLAVPAERYPEYNFVGRLLGPRGATLKQLERETGCKIMIRGRGSIRKDKEGEVRGKPGWEHVFNEPLHVVIEADSMEDDAVCHRALNRAREAVELLLVPVPEDRDSLKRQQLRDLAILNGTFRGSSCVGNAQSNGNTNGAATAPIGSTRNVSMSTATTQGADGGVVFRMGSLNAAVLESEYDYLNHVSQQQGELGEMQRPAWGRSLSLSASAASRQFGASKSTNALLSDNVSRAGALKRESGGSTGEFADVFGLREDLYRSGAFGLLGRNGTGQDRNTGGADETPNDGGTDEPVVVHDDDLLVDDETFVT